MGEITEYRENFDTQEEGEEETKICSLDSSESSISITKGQETSAELVDGNNNEQESFMFNPGAAEFIPSTCFPTYATSANTELFIPGGNYMKDEEEGVDRQSLFQQNYTKEVAEPLDATQGNEEKDVDVEMPNRTYKLNPLAPSFFPKWHAEDIQSNIYAGEGNEYTCTISMAPTVGQHSECNASPQLLPTNQPMPQPQEASCHSNYQNAGASIGNQQCDLNSDQTCLKVVPLYKLIGSSMAGGNEEQPSSSTRFLPPFNPTSASPPPRLQLAINQVLQIPLNRRPEQCHFYHNQYFPIPHQALLAPQTGWNNNPGSYTSGNFEGQVLPPHPPSTQDHGLPSQDPPGVSVFIPNVMSPANVDNGLPSLVPVIVPQNPRIAKGFNPFPLFI